MHETRTPIQAVEDLLSPPTPSTDSPTPPPRGKAKSRHADTPKTPHPDMETSQPEATAQSFPSSNRTEDTEREEGAEVMEQMIEANRLMGLATTLAGDAERRERLSRDCFKAAVGLLGTYLFARLPRKAVIVLTVTGAALSYSFQKQAKKDRAAGRTFYESSVESLPASFREVLGL